MDIDLNSSRKLKALFCPKSLIDSLTEFGQKEPKKIYPRSHKCQFRLNQKTYLTELQIRTNTYARMVKRTFKSEQHTGLILYECLEPFILGLQLAAGCPAFAANYTQIRQGLYNLMICYAHDLEVQTVLTSIIQCLPKQER